MVPLTEQTTRLIGVALTVAYAGFILWVYAQQPRTMAEVAGGLASTVGGYRIDQQQFETGRRFFHDDRFPESRAALERADPARRDPGIQFYIAYSYYREGWGRIYHDDELYAKGLAALDRAVSMAPSGQAAVEDPALGMHSSDELRAELVRGRTRELSDFNPLRVLRRRK